LARQGEALPRNWVELGEPAAERGDVHCLRVLRECGFELHTWAWVAAASGGHFDCLVFALSHGYVLNDSVVYDSFLSAAVKHGRLAVVDLVLQQGLPREPFFLNEFRVGPHSMKCIESLLEKGVAIDPESLIAAARNGDLDFVRMLYKHGIPLWQHAREMESFSLYQMWSLTSREVHTTLVMPWRLDNEYGAWKALRYGSLHGAPVTPRVQQFFEEKRQQTHAVLLCFRAAARLSKAPGCPERRRMWAGRAALPSALIEEILICADLEIRESVMHQLPVPGLSAPFVG
jgi:hypothetical protein